MHRFFLRYALLILVLGTVSSCRFRNNCSSVDLVCNPLLAALLYTRVQVPKFVLIANAGTNNVSVFRINPTTGGLTAVQGSPFAAGTAPRFTAVDPTGSFVYVVGNGGTVFGYTIDISTGFLTPMSGSPFAGGATLYSATIHPSGRFLYAGSDSAGSIYGYSIGSSGSLTALSGSPFSAPANPAGVTAEPSGRFLFAGINNTPNGRVAVFSIDSTGGLSQVSGSPFVCGDDTLSVTTDLAGRFIYGVNYFSTNVFGYVMNASGSLTQVSGSPFAAGSASAFVTVDPAGRFAYVANSGDASGLLAVSGYTINQSTGALTQVTGSPFAAGANPIGVATDPHGKFLYSANTASNNVSAFTIDQTTGIITTVAGSPYVAAGGSPQPFAVTILSRYEF
ncbi:MAG: beta-propeller fold lactonase family protein [Leptospirales bacterium]|nr:beta-propeller fold lactonase family protein [Leptospirales bacterium]